MKTVSLTRCGFTVLMGVLLLASCSSLPVIKPLDRVLTEDTVQRCRKPFSPVPYRVVHAIEAEIPGMPLATLMGVTIFDPHSGIIHSALLTLEGFVLFDACYDKGLQVNRAVPPFDAGHFGGNMMADLRLMFLAPQGRLLNAGLLEDGSHICRYEGHQGRTVDVVIRRDGAWEIGTYGEYDVELRRVRAKAIRNGIPEMMELTGFHGVSYVLRMTLISAEPVSSETFLSRDKDPL